MSSELGKNFDCTKELKDRQKRTHWKASIVLCGFRRITKSKVYKMFARKNNPGILVLSHGWASLQRWDLNFFKELVLWLHTMNTITDKYPDVVQTAVSPVPTGVTEQIVNLKWSS